MQDERSRWERWRDESYNPVARALKGKPFASAQLLPVGMRVELTKDTPTEERRKLELLLSEAGHRVVTQLPTRDIIFVRRG